MLLRPGRRDRLRLGQDLGAGAGCAGIVNAYIEVIRNTPFLVQLFFFFFALPAIGLRWSPHTAALTAMVVNLGAYATEIIRAGIESIPEGPDRGGPGAQPQAAARSSASSSSSRR